MKLTENKLRSLIKEEALKLHEENLYELTADDIVKIVYSDEDRKVYSHIKNIASKLGLADNPLRGAMRKATGGRKMHGGPELNAQAITAKFEQLGFDKNEIHQIRDSFSDAAQRAMEATKQKFPQAFEDYKQRHDGDPQAPFAFEPREDSFMVYTFPAPQQFPQEVTEWFHSRVRFLAKKNLERLNFIE